jgi:hypothetical protein
MVMWLQCGFHVFPRFQFLERAKYIHWLFLTLHLDILIAGYCSVSTKGSLFLGFSITDNMKAFSETI